MSVVALCGEDEKVLAALNTDPRFQVLIFSPEVQRAPETAFCYFLREGGLCDLAVIAYPGARGMNACRAIRGQRPQLPILWLSDQAEFLPESKRIPVQGFCAPVPNEKSIRDLVGGLLIGLKS